MPNQKLGITATELFACNPFRILGLPVTAEESEIAATYQKLAAMAGTPEADNYTTDFDFTSSLPSFKRDAATLKTAYAKLASNGYRCFAYSDGIFSQSLNIDDVMLNLKDITCYDCFLRCYMWLITNDRDFEEPELWVPLCKYIDKMIASAPNQWGKYFDNRFPQSENTPQMLEDFHATFSDIILLPIKEMVRGSMRCKSAIDILKAAKVDVDEVFPDIDIPQANKPQAGQPEPKLKIAVKDGEEYFDLSLGKMVSFESESEAAVENNLFAAAATSISADAIIGEEEPAPVAETPTYAEPEPAPAPQPQTVTYTEPAPAYEAKPEPVPQPAVKPAEPINIPEKPAVKIAVEEPKPAPAPTYTADSYNFPAEGNVSNLNIHATVDDTAKAPEEPQVAFYKPKTAETSTQSTTSAPYDPFAAAGGSKPSGQPAAVAQAVTPKAGRRRGVNLTGLDEVVQADNSQMSEIQFTAPKGARPAAVAEEQKPVSKKSERRTLTDIIEDVESKTEETANALLTEQEEEDNLYTDVLIKMLRSNRTGKMMKGVDTTHVFDNGDSVGQAKEMSELTMDSINMNKIDKSRLDSAYDGSRQLDESDPKKAMQEKYKNININDMLNPTIGGRLNREYQPNAIEEYKKAKEENKRLSRTMLKLFGFGILVAAIIAFLILMTNG